MKTKILFLGMGYTTVWAYRHLMKNLGKIALENVHLEILSDSPNHAFHGFTGEFLAGALPLQTRYTSYEELFPEAHFTQGFVTKVDQTKQVVYYFDAKTQSNQVTAYDQLVIGMGARDATERIEGTSAFALSVKDPLLLKKIRQRIIETVDCAKTIQDLNFVVCGGGLAGVEICGNLCEYLEQLKSIYPILHTVGYQVHLIQSGETILPQLLPFKRLIAYCEREFSAYHAKIHLKSRVKAFKKNGVLLESGVFIQASVVISTLGQVVCSPDTVLPFQQDALKRIHGNSYLNAIGFENIWVGGDVAHIAQPRGQGACRADAIWAIQHGTLIGRNLARTLQNRPLKAFTFSGLGQTAAIGKNKGFSEMYGICLTGCLAWWIRLFVFLYFMPSRAKAWTVLNYFWSDYRNLLPEKQEIALNETVYHSQCQS
jgi:NADH:ubiquinone reductase (H+-translocating)